MHHWLSSAARRARIAGADDVRIEPGTPVTDAWDVVARGVSLTQSQLADRIAPAVGVRLANMETGEARALTLLPERIARKYNVFPLREDDRTITVATSDPMDVTTEQAISFASARRAVFELAPPGLIADAINAGYSPDGAVEKLLRSVGMDLADSVQIVEDTAPEAVAERDVEAGPIVKLTNLIIHEAVVSRASDVHVEPSLKGGVVRFRVDGVLRVYMQLPMGALNRIVSRIKVVAKLDIADRLRPQDGRARVSVEGKTYDLRVSTVPTRDAEKAVIRVLRPDSVTSFEAAGMQARDVSLIRHLLGFREGIVLVTGPTGSGKTTTLYVSLREVAQRAVNIVTVEDPIEYELPGITQIQVEEKRGVTFASALRAVLRQDPDVIFVGEIRDIETAEVAVQAALTGHLVLATLHTNDALSAVTRLQDLGLSRSSIAASVRGSVAQRLIRRLCTSCAQEARGEITPDEARLARTLGARPVMRAVGCDACGNTGYRGRIPIMEIATITPGISELIASDASVAALQRAAVAGGMRSLRDAALERAAKGETTLQEVERVVGEAAEEPLPRGTTPVAAMLAVSGANPAGPMILVVDDDPVLRAVASKLLREGGYRVETANDGADALRRVTTGDAVSLIVTDLHMPNMTGAALLSAVRASDAAGATPVIVLTGNEDNAEEVRLMDAGADDYIRKPIDPDRFVARVRAALRRANL
ncbi:MAG TPA: ATPase, T2SS/T4P/T4SS family [Gemmatimonadaceae bacterium]|nr:ATPase, T2SS/T4P/T4SS family [Gemmatimonadaceae bacterium]